MTGKIFRYNLKTGVPMGFFHDGLNPLRLQWLDDFMVDSDCATLIGAGYHDGTVRRMDPSTNTSAVMHTGLTNPTAVLWGPSGDPNFRDTSLYVTEGGSFESSTTSRRIVEIPNARAPVVPSQVRCWNYLEGQG